MDMTLVVLAAGMGSRYGGLKQLDKIGPSGETVMDYSVYDAIRAGFNRVVFVIRKDIEDDFKTIVGSRYSERIKVEYAFQSLDDLPSGFSLSSERSKPWGTGHAVYAARELLNTPFAVINADDFYGEDSYKKVAQYLSNAPEYSGKIRGCICAFPLINTLSENGSVSRGVCAEGSDATLSSVTELTKILRKENGEIVNLNDDGTQLPLSGNELVSLNCWGFMPEFVGELEKLFSEFLSENQSNIKSEFYLPFAIDSLISQNKATFAMSVSSSSWYGITYKEDKPLIVDAIKTMVNNGAYPEKL